MSEDKKREKLAEVDQDVHKFEMLLAASDGSSSASLEDKVGKAKAKQQFLMEQLGLMPAGDHSRPPVYYGKRALSSASIEWEPSLQATLEYADFKEKVRLRS